MNQASLASPEPPTDAPHPVVALRFLEGPLDELVDRLGVPMPGWLGDLPPVLDPALIPEHRQIVETIG